MSAATKQNKKTDSRGCGMRRKAHKWEKELLGLIHDVALSRLFRLRPRELHHLGSIAHRVCDASIATPASFDARRLREPDPASAPCHTKPQAQRYERRKSAEQRSIGGQARSRHAAANRERKKEHQEERRHLHPEGKAVITLDRFGKEQGNTRREHQGHAAEQPRLSICPQLRGALFAQAHA